MPGGCALIRNYDIVSKMAIILRLGRSIKYCLYKLDSNLRICSWRLRYFNVGSMSCTTVSSLQQPLTRYEILGKVYNCDEMTSVTPAIISKVGRNLHCVSKHPINVIKQRIVHHFHKLYTTRTGNAIYAHFDNVSPIVTTEQNFDSLLVAKDHVTRSRNDNYYINGTTLLRAHTSAHQCDFIRMGCNQFLVTGDVYRRDEIDSSHYPIFHQMEGVRLFSREELFKSCDDNDSDLLLFESDPNLRAETSEKQAPHTMDAVKMMEFNLKETLIKLMKELFGNDIESRWTSCYFPFTHPSFELEIKFQGEWMEMLGCGIMRQQILENGGVSDRIGWAFGLGLDRLAMLLFEIPDIRLFWSKDERFLEQFSSVSLDPKTNIKFKHFSKYPPCFKDITFWLPQEGFNENDFHEVVRSSAEDLVERVELIDKFTHPKIERLSHCYRITYRSMDRNVTNEEINVIQEKIRQLVVNKLNVELR